MSDLLQAALPSIREANSSKVYRRGEGAPPIIVPQVVLPAMPLDSACGLGSRGRGVQEKFLREVRVSRTPWHALQRTPAEREAEASYLSNLVDHARVDCAEAEAWLHCLPVTCDLIFGSPPYTNARRYTDDDGMTTPVFKDPIAWAVWMADIYELCLRRCRGLVAFVVAGRTQRFQYNCAPRLLVAELYYRGICVRNPAVWTRDGIAGSGGPDYLRSSYEHIVVASNGGRLPWSDNTAMGHAPKYGPGGSMSHRLSDGSRRNAWGGTAKSGGERRPHGGRNPARGDHGLATVKTPVGYTPPKIANPGNVIHVPVGGGLMGDSAAHENEAPFPERIPEFWIRSFCPPGGLVADPFLGSGTTAAVAKKFGRLGIGCDLRMNQCAIARERLARVTWEESLGSATGHEPGSN